MLITTFILSLAMFFFLLNFRKIARKKIIQYMAIIYMMLFGSVSLGISSFYLYNADLPSLFSSVLQAKKTQIHTLKNNNLMHKTNVMYQIEAPVIHQFPELPRGCEVTSLAMLLQIHDIDVNKMELAEAVKKDETPYTRKNGVTQFGDPNNGFVGDMYNFDNPGYGVYHEPLYQLAKEYVGDRAIDLTGNSFDAIKDVISNGLPVAVITNISNQPLPETEFTTWQTPNGPVDITMKLHAVLVTGFDSQNIYFNDPYDGKQKKAPKQAFIAAWEQMGKQAISIQ